MSQQQPGLESVVGKIVGASLLVIAFVNGGASAFLTKLGQDGVSAGAEGYVEFAFIYFSTFLLSVTVTAVIAYYGVASILGKQVHPMGGVMIAVLGAGLTGLPVTTGSPGTSVMGAIKTFLTYYGPESFLGGLVTGAAAGVIVLYLTERAVKGTA